MDEETRPSRPRPLITPPWRLQTLVLAGIGLALIGVACGGGGSSGAATGTSTTHAATVPAQVSASPTASKEADATSATISLVAKSISFDRTSVEAVAGEVTINLDNQDQGIPHNIHVFRGDGPDGESVGMTEIASGPTHESVTLQVQAGSFFFHCDVHPNQMKGTLVVH